MGLKGDRHEFQTDISYILNDVAERGLCVLYKTGGSGAALDDSLAVVQVSATPASGTARVAGLLLNDMVNFDTNRQHINFYADEMLVGGHATLLRKGWVVTNSVLAGVNPAVGDKAYVSLSGRLSNAVGGPGCTNAGPVGEFMGVKDVDGYIKVAIDLP